MIGCGVPNPVVSRLQRLSLLIRQKATVVLGRGNLTFMSVAKEEMMARLVQYIRAVRVRAEDEHTVLQRAVISIA